MPWNWSNPGNNPENGPEEQGRFQFREAELGRVLGAILANNRKTQEDTARSASGLAAALSQNSQSSANDDAANRALYLEHNPGATADLSNPNFDQNYVPDYGGQEALKAEQIADALKQKASTADNQVQFVKMPDGSTLAVGPHGNKLWDSNDNGGASRINATAANAYKSQIESAIGEGVDNVNNVQYGDFDENGNFVPNPKGSQAMIGSPHRYTTPAVPGGWITSGTPAKSGVSDYTNVFPRDTAARMQDLGQQYYKYLGMGQGPQGAPLGLDSGQTSTRAGSGPTDGEIEVLKEHPESAPLFDQKYGKGSAAAYLQPVQGYAVGGMIRGGGQIRPEGFEVEPDMLFGNLGRGPSPSRPAGIRGPDAEGPTIEVPGDSRTVSNGPAGMGFPGSIWTGPTGEITTIGNSGYPRAIAVGDDGSTPFGDFSPGSLSSLGNSGGWGSNVPPLMLARRGGPIIGGSHMRDDVPIMGEGGEYMLRQRVARAIGPKMLDRINALPPDRAAALAAHMARMLGRK